MLGMLRCVSLHFFFLHRKRKLDHVLKPLENSQDLEEKYQEKLLSYENLKKDQEREIADVRFEFCFQ